MTSVPPPTMPDLPEATDIPAPNMTSSRFSRLPWIWLMPLITALLGIGLFIQSVQDKGPTIVVRFQTAQGLEPGVTKVKYKEVEVGEVTGVRLSGDLSQVLAEIALNKSVQKFAVEDSRFWVVRPRVAASGVSGLNTLLSGAYIGVEAGNSNVIRKKFVGLETPPVMTGDQKGREFTLHSNSIGSLDQGSPVFFRRIQVGQVIRCALDEDGKGITAFIFVKAPYDRYIHTNTRFWHASGVDFQLDTNGFKLHTQSLATLVAGGVEFQTVTAEDIKGAEMPAPEGAAFRLAANMNEALQEGGGLGVRATLYFDSSIKGLTVGAPVDFWGLTFGRVLSTRMDFDIHRQAFRVAVDVLLYAERIQQLVQALCQSGVCASADLSKARGIDFRAHQGADPALPSVAKSLKQPQPLHAAVVRPLSSDIDPGTEQYAQSVALLVKHGLRAQLRVANMFMKSLYIGLDFLPRTSQIAAGKGRIADRAPSTTVRLSAEKSMEPALQHSALEIPTLPGEINSMQQTASVLLGKLKKVPFDQIGLGLQHTLAQADKMLVQMNTQLVPQANRTLQALEHTLEQTQANLQPDSSIQADIHSTLTEFTRAMQSLNTLTDYLARHPEALLRGQPREENTP